MKLENKMHEIARALFQYIKESNAVEFDELGLLSGKSGMFLFLSHYLKKYPNTEDDAVYEKFASDFFDELTSRHQTIYTYCTGLTGVLKTLEILNRSSLVEIDYSEIESTYRNNLYEWMDNRFANGDNDFLHGAIGVAMYYKNDPQFIEAALSGLEKSSITDKNRLKWISNLGQNRHNGYNISLSHGISSIVIYLSQVYNSGVKTNLCSRLLEGAVNYVLSQQISAAQYGCYFPSQSLDNGEPTSQSRLAWCYGDLGVAAALWQAGKATGNMVWLEKAMEVYWFSTGRTDFNDAMVKDAGLCHGTAGIAMMFAYMYRETLDRKFKDARDYWIDQTLNMGRFSNSPAGYKKITMNENGIIVWEDSFSLLEGIAGIGLMLLSAMDIGVEKDLLTALALC